MPIGFVDRQDLRSFLLPLRPGDALVVFSDGLSECQNADGEAFGEDRVMRVVKARFDLSARELADGLVRLVFEFSRSGFSDDVTLVCLRVMAGVPEALHQGFLVLKLGSGTAEATRALRSAVLACLGKNGAVGEDADIIALACHEALENVAEHGLKGRDGTCRASWLCREGTFFLELSYRGDEYDWLARTAAPTESYRGRGYGQAIIREVMDSVLFCRGFDDEKSLILCRRTPWRK